MLVNKHMHMKSYIYIQNMVINVRPNVVDGIDLKTSENDNILYKLVCLMLHKVFYTVRILQEFEWGWNLLSAKAIFSNLITSKTS